MVFLFFFFFWNSLFFDSQRLFVYGKLLPLYFFSFKFCLEGASPVIFFLCCWLHLVCDPQSSSLWVHFQNFRILVAVFHVWVIAHCIYIPHFFQIWLSMDLSWVCVFTIWSSTGVNIGAHVSFWIMVFCNISPGVGIKILGLALLKFFLLDCGGCCF